MTIEPEEVENMSAIVMILKAYSSSGMDFSDPRMRESKRHFILGILHWFYVKIGATSDKELLSYLMSVSKKTRPIETKLTEILRSENESASDRVMDRLNETLDDRGDFKE